jgi:hypothetical protein
LEEEPSPHFSEGKERFGSAKGLFKYFSSLHLSLGLLQFCLVDARPLYAAGITGVLALFALGPSFRFLWQRADWFRVSLVGQVLLQLVFASAALGFERRSLSGWGVIASLVLVLPLLPVQTRFCRKYDIPD